MQEIPVGSRTVSVLDSEMHLWDVGSGTPVLFLHGNPTSGYLWRHVLGRRVSGYRCLALDLIGMGRSGKPAIGYRLSDHIRYVDALLESLDLGDVVIVAHDWGVAIALDRIRRFPEQVKAIAFMEAHLRPLPGWEAFDTGGRGMFTDLRTPGVGERMVLEENFFIDTLLPAALMGKLSPEDQAVYREPYPDPVSRLPLLAWPREIPIGGDPPDVAQTMALGAGALLDSAIPKLLLHGRPGVIVTPEIIRWCQSNLSSLTVTDVGGPSGHFLPEDRHIEVADAIWAWLSTLT
ncbi:MAG: haloalkane dehalogenase [Propionicimonas sp.]